MKVFHITNAGRVVGQSMEHHNYFNSIYTLLDSAYNRTDIFYRLTNVIQEKY